MGADQKAQNPREEGFGSPSADLDFLLETHGVCTESNTSVKKTAPTPNRRCAGAAVVTASRLHDPGKYPLHYSPVGSTRYLSRQALSIGRHSVLGIHHDLVVQAESKLVT